MDLVQMCSRYDRWEDVPPHLKTRTMLNRMGLRPAPGQVPAAVIERTFRRETWEYALYDVGQAVRKRAPTEAQRAALAAGRRLAGRKRLYGRCGMCGEEWDRAWLAISGVCLSCAEADEAAIRAEDRTKAARWARAVLADPCAMILDTETTDLDGDIIEMAILTMQSTVLLDTLVHSLREISPEAQAVHGLTRVDLQEAPPFVHVYAQVSALLAQATCIVAYNAGFDLAALHRTCTQ
jgi:DNA polymerase-3 subunit epsilon